MTKALYGIGNAHVNTCLRYVHKKRKDDIAEGIETALACPIGSRWTDQIGTPRLLLNCSGDKSELGDTGRLWD